MKMSNNSGFLIQLVKKKENVIIRRYGDDGSLQLLQFIFSNDERILQGTVSLKLKFNVCAHIMKRQGEYSFANTSP